MEFRLLGDMQAWHDGERVPLGGPRQRSVLAVLLLASGGTVTVDRIVDRAWPADPPDTVLDLVTSYISRLRRQFELIGAEIELASRRPGYAAVIDPELVDVHRFTRLHRQARTDREGLDTELAAVHLREALDLWRGTAFADLESPWLKEQSVRFKKARLDAVEELAEIELAAGHAGEIFGQLREMAEAHPDRERLTVLSIRALSAAGESLQAVDLATRTVRSLQKQGMDPSPALRQAHSDALNPQNRPGHVHADVGPAQLPPDTSAFTGRGQELDSLITVGGGSHASDTVIISAIDGMAGIGKTALAVHAAHRLAERFPDGQLFIDLHGFTPGTTPTTPEYALDRFLRALGVSPQQIPRNAEDRAALYRDRLASTRTLIVLDNAATEAQIRPLLPAAPGCLVLITSRRRLTGLDDAQAIRLNVLPDADAVALFSTIAGAGRAPATDPAVAEIVELCGNMPLAIRIAGARLRNRPKWTPQTLAARLRDQTRRLSQLDDGERNLTAALAVSYDHLAEQEQRMFRLLGLHPGTDIDVYAAAALAGTSPDSTDDVLERLVDHNLLDQPGVGRYQLHDLVRIFARTLAGEGKAEGDIPLAPLLDYYLYTAGQANFLLTRRAVSSASAGAQPPAAAPQFAGNEEATYWMEAERANLAAMADYAAENGLQLHAIALPAAMHGFLRSQGHWAQALRLQRMAFAAAEHINDRQGQANALCSLGDVLVVTGQYSQASDALELALTMYSDLSDRLGQADAYSSLAHLHRLTAHFAQSMEPLRQALGLYSDLGDWLGQANVLATLGAVEKQTGQYIKAEETLSRSIDLYTRIGHRLGQTAALTDLGEVQQLAGQYPEAVETLQRALDQYRSLGNRNGQAEALTNLGEVYLLTEQYLEADTAVHHALLLYRELGNQLGQATALTTLGAVQRSRTQHAQAASTLRQGLLLHRQLGNRLGQATALTALTEVQRALGDHEGAAESHRQALALYQDIDDDL